ncbi:GNAT family N-acetyltransferase [Chelatococcus sp. SYSU_G07232]|uniref:GNAT family N-acetyltransferase n=1 Tax=Chelatococcus albus TaxID=3047466 RepID=A0ABT7AF66_9HYPH|nr:GNAT family N-acetyltransferase [Chelatococcus sp. SYSU_G07232]MDJ1157271.1 GNAT family N-acetyltransferase [Chelatococcus sp. SYSU_G07232]
MTIVTEPARMDLDRIHAWLAASYRAAGLPRQVLDRSVEGSLCFAAFDAAGGICAFARVVSDRATFAHLCDVIVDPARRGGGIGKALVAAIMAHPHLQGLRR